jgi:tetratricopeptide (TPR) repeat protein
MRALALADSVVQRNPSLALGWIARGAAFRAVGQMGDARRALDRAVTLEPNSVEAHYRLGQLHVVTGEYEEAQQRLTRVLTLDPGHAVTYYYLGVTAYFERRMTDARRTLDSALTLDPTFLGALHWRMVVLIAARDSAEARRSMETYFQLNEVARRRLDTARTFGDSVVATGGMVAHTLAQRLALVGQHEEALRLIATRRVRGDSQPDPQIDNPHVCRHVVADPAFDPVRRDPRFVEYEKACLALRPDQHEPPLLDASGGDRGRSQMNSEERKQKAESRRDEA